ncbi:MAG: DMT family protein, partial [Candidatus Sumerlaeota bacterium]
QGIVPRRSSDPFQLKLIQEAIGLIVFVVFAAFYLNEPVRWNHIAAFVLIFGGVYMAFLPKPAAAIAPAQSTELK